MNATLFWLKDWDGLPVLDSACCPHPASSALALDLRVVRPKRGPARLETAGTLCMACGVEQHGRLSLLNALELACAEHGWNIRVIDRLAVLAHHHRAAIEVDAALPSIWMLSALGRSPDEICAAIDGRSEA